jgi:hypothetical protein
MRAFAFLLVGCAAGAAPVDFSREIRPLLSENCFSCHGPDEKQRMAGLRLDTREGALSRIKPGDAAASPLFQRISHEKKALRMPPLASGRSLEEKQVALIKRWIDEGAAWKTHWSYSPPVRAELPTVKDKAWAKTPIDHFVLARLEKEGLRPSPEADRATLLRRVSLDLTGLPPAPGEVAAFLKDKAPGAYEKVVDRLLASRHYGEKMALHWLDLARYADTHGYHIDPHRVMWTWRDWVINAFNVNKRWDEFVVEQLAGDLLPNATPDQRLATGFNRNHMINFEGGAIEEEYRTEYVIDRVETTANVFMGMTMGCARCHDHKYDPISQKDFYRFFAFFNTVDEKGLDGRRGNAEPRMFVASHGQISEIERMDAEIKAKRNRLGEKDVDAAQEAWEKTLPSAAGMQRRLSEGLEFHYEFEGGLEDSSGHYRSAKMTASEAAYTNGMVGRAAVLTVDEKVALASDVLEDQRKPFTLAAFVRPTHERTIRLFEKGTGFQAYTGVSSYVPYYKRGSPLTLVFGERRLVSEEPLLYTVFTHVALTYDGASFRLYFDGKPVSLRVVNDAPAHFAGREPLSIRDFQGQLDDLRFYNRVLADRELNDLALHLSPLRTVEIPAAKRTKEEKDRLRGYFLVYGAAEELREIAAKLAKQETERLHLGEVVPSAMVMAEMKENPREAFVLGRGDYRNRGEKVEPAVPSALPPLPSGVAPNRLGLARWLTDPSHPLLTRVTVNRFWQNYFGTGLVKTSEDFGSQGEPPSHPELLDWLATEFIRTNWDVKAMQKMIVMSATYRQSSRVTPELHERDPENRLLAHMSRFRLQAELVRDNALAASGLLNAEVGGPSVFPYEPAGLWDEMAFGREYTAQKYTPSHGQDLYRRGMYTFWKRTVPPAGLTTFDAPDREKCLSRRAVTNTPLQALALMNDPTFVEAARVLAQRILRDGGRRPEERIAFAYQRVLARPPNKREAAVLAGVAAKQTALYGADDRAARALLAVGESKADSQLPIAELAAWTNVATMILNLDEAITKE